MDEEIVGCRNQSGFLSLLWLLIALITIELYMSLNYYLEVKGILELEL